MRWHWKETAGRRRGGGTEYERTRSSDGAPRRPAGEAQGARWRVWWRTRIPALSLRLSPISGTYVMTRLGLPIPGWPMGKLAVALVVRCVKGEKTHDQGSAGPRGCGIGSSGHQTSPLKPLEERPRAERNTPGLSNAAPRGRRTIMRHLVIVFLAVAVLAGHAAFAVS